jgi:hypothetical protein
MSRYNPDDYVDVADRISRFWTEYPDGAIRTELASPASAFTEVVFRAEVYKKRDSVTPDAVGYAAEKPGSGANQTSWHENCETSAIGRALANMGYATSQKDRPSKQEMRKVNRAEPTPARTVNDIAGGTIAPGVGMTDQQRKAIFGIGKSKAMTREELEAVSQEMFGVELAALDKQQASKVIERLDTGVMETHPKVQQAIDNREATWLAAMEGAATMAELQRIGAEIAQAGVKEGPLRVAYAKQRDRLQEKALV